jgi:translation initiation factor 3 subunit L
MASGSFKFQAADFVDSWTTYSQLFDFIRSVEDNELMLTPQWVYDIVQEYVYQFQGFCQYRSSSREPAVVLANKQAWAVATVHRTLTDLIALFAPQATTTKSHFGYFAMIELSRLECLLGDFSASISSVSSVRIFDRTELFNTVLSSHVNMYYHACVSLLMLRRFADSIQVLSEALLHISRVLRPGAGALRQPSQSVLQKMMDKVLALLAISMALSPGTRVDDQVRELVEQRVQDKYRRMQTGDVSAFEEAFEAACPKFISPCVPTVYPTANLCHETVRMVVSVFMSEVRQHAALLKLRSYMRLYSAVQVDKLARLNDSTEAELLSQLVAYKHKHSEAAASTTVMPLLLIIHHATALI